MWGGTAGLRASSTVGRIGGAIRDHLVSGGKCAPGAARNVALRSCRGHVMPGSGRSRRLTETACSAAVVVGHERWQSARRRSSDGRRQAAGVPWRVPRGLWKSAPRVCRRRSGYALRAWCGGYATGSGRARPKRRYRISRAAVDRVVVLMRRGWNISYARVRSLEPKLDERERYCIRNSLSDRSPNA